MTTPEILNLIGRAGVAFYFLWSVPFNVRARGHHLAEFQRIGAPFGPVLFSVGIFLALAGSLAFLYTPTAVVGGAMLIAFTVAADGMFHRYWTYTDPGEQVIHKFFLFEHVALCGGILGLMAGTL